MAAAITGLNWMSNYLALDPQQHAAVKVSEQQALVFAASQHLINTRVTEVAQLACDLPIFISKSPHGDWALSALTSVVPGQNLWIAEGRWQPTYLPMLLQTYPLYALPGSEQGQLQLGLMADPLSMTAGLSLFEDSHQPSLELQRRMKLVETDLQNEYLTFRFLQQLQQWHLIQHIELVLNKGTEEQRIQGLYTINEDRLAQLSAEQLKTLQQQGQLLPIHSMLLSLLQLNKLIQKHNSLPQFEQIKSIKLVLPK